MAPLMTMTPRKMTASRAHMVIITLGSTWPSSDCDDETSRSRRGRDWYPAPCDSGRSGRASHRVAAVAGARESLAGLFHKLVPRGPGSERSRSRYGLAVRRAVVRVRGG